MLTNTLFFKYIKKTDVYLILTLNNNIIGSFNNIIKSPSFSTYSKSLYKYNLFFRHLNFFGFLPMYNQKEFKLN